MTESMKDDVRQDMYETLLLQWLTWVGYDLVCRDHAEFGEAQIHQLGHTQIELIWQRPKKFPVYLFLLNRYLTPLGFIVNLVAYNLSSWDSTQASTNDGNSVFAMYRNQWPAIALAVFLLLAWIVVTAWLLSHGEPCTMVFNSYVLTTEMQIGSIASASAWLPLLYDTYVFGLTLNRTLPSIRKQETGHVFRTLFADGLLYYRAHPGVKNIAAQLELLLTVTMMSRITLNLRKQAFYGPSPHHSQVESIILSTRNDAIYTPSGGVVVLSRLRSHSVSSAARAESSNRARSGSASSIVSPVRTITFAENPSIPATRPRLSTIFSATNTPTTQSPISGSPVSEHADWPSASNSDQRDTAGIV
ncbi:hypothetical protein EDB19DRAFT_1824804 [Suillus lakei]|nr:hypothetical protein EDB19DRAFT_1824804 [Suillus lakei]